MGDSEKEDEGNEKEEAETEAEKETETESVAPMRTEEEIKVEAIQKLETLI